MKKVIMSIIILVMIIGAFLAITYTRQPKSEGKPELEIPLMEKEKVGITLISVYDNYQVNPELKTGWGFGCVIKTEKEEILFDTGGNSEILLFNLKKMGINPKSIDKVVISHIHGDHLGGLEGFLKENNEVTVFIPSSFPDSIRNMIKSYGTSFLNVSGPTKISDLIWSTGELYGPPQEQSLIIVSKKGLIIITGCAHPGIVNIVKFAKKMWAAGGWRPKEEIYLVLGGFHSPPLSIIEEFKNLEVKKVAPSHCTGDKVREAFRKEYREDFIEYGVGKIIEISD